MYVKGEFYWIPASANFVYNHNATFHLWLPVSSLLKRQTNLSIILFCCQNNFKDDIIVIIPIFTDEETEAQRG